MLRVITMTSYRRPAYTREVLSALARCDGIAGWVLLPNVEPGNDEVIQEFRNWSACESRLVVNKTRLGLNRNTHAAVLRAHILEADVVVHLEDDTVPSIDALSYFEWAVKDVLMPNIKSPDGHQILLASGYNKPASEPASDTSRTCRTRPIWTPWGWAVDRSRLGWMIMKWCFRNPKCFTCQFKSGYRRTRREIFPSLSRIQNIGYESGENNRSPAWYRAHHRTPWVAGDHESGEWKFPKAT